MVGACQGPTAESSGFSSTPAITTVGVGSTDTTAGGTTGGSAGGSSTSSGGSTSGESGSGDTTVVLDLGTLPDAGDGNPVGCKGKIDLLFVISRDPNMEARQAKLIEAFPKFIETIEAKFEDFDYHIMVIDGDDEQWGSEFCNDDCPIFDCEIGEECCPINAAPEKVGESCCSVEDYPCEYVDLVSDCDTKFGAGSVFPAGNYASNRLCPIDGGRRYMVKGQKDLAETFACVAQIGVNGRGQLGEALTAAMHHYSNDPGGCNPGFLRDDALLMVTFIQANPDHGGGGLESDGFAEDWAKAVLDAKHGDPESVVMLSFGTTYDWGDYDEITRMAKMFPYGRYADLYETDFSAAFEEATGLVETACAVFVPG
jgi:hypothetical protein